MLRRLAYLSSESFQEYERGCAHKRNLHSGKWLSMPFNKCHFVALVHHPQYRLTLTTSWLYRGAYRKLDIGLRAQFEASYSVLYIIRALYVSTQGKRVFYRNILTRALNRVHPSLLNLHTMENLIITGASDRYIATLPSIPSAIRTWDFRHGAFAECWYFFQWQSSLQCEVPSDYREAKRRGEHAESCPNNNYLKGP
jgi:hypothetical protein